MSHFHAGYGHMLPEFKIPLVHSCVTLPWLSSSNRFLSKPSYIRLKYIGELRVCVPLDVCPVETSSTLGPGDGSYVLASLLVCHIFIQQLSNDFLILHMVFFGNAFEIGDAFRAKGNSHLCILVFQRQLFW